MDKQTLPANESITLPEKITEPNVNILTDDKNDKLTKEEKIICCNKCHDCKKKSTTK
jgi:hypothetical protein